MMKEISEAILEYLQDAGINTRQIDYKEIVDRQVGSLQRPAVNISISRGNWEKVTMDKRKLNLTISLLLMVQNAKNEKKRRYDSYSIIEAISSALFIISMGLDLQDLIKPVSFQDVTDNKFADAGYQIYQVNFTCSYMYEQVKEDFGLLRTIVNNYTMDDEIKLTTILTSGYWGGSASEHGRLEDAIFGGRANTEFRQDPIWGGNARTIHAN